MKAQIFLCYAREDVEKVKQLYQKLAAAGRDGEYEMTSAGPPSTSRTGWLAPRWPNLSLKVAAPKTRPSIWWPRQMPMMGFLPSSFLSEFQKIKAP